MAYYTIYIYTTLYSSPCTHTFKLIRNTQHTRSTTSAVLRRADREHAPTLHTRQVLQSTAWLPAPHSGEHFPPGIHTHSQHQQNNWHLPTEHTARDHPHPSTHNANKTLHAKVGSTCSDFAVNTRPPSPHSCADANKGFAILSVLLSWEGNSMLYTLKEEYLFRFKMNTKFQVEFLYETFFLINIVRKIWFKQFDDSGKYKSRVLNTVRLWIGTHSDSFAIVVFIFLRIHQLLTGFLLQCSLPKL